MGTLLRINMTDRSYALEELPEEYKLLAGRGLTSTIVHDEVDPLCHPLGPNNKLIFSTGIVTGTSAPTSARISVGAKSPLTGGIKEANAGSGFAPSLARMGIRALVVEGQPKEKNQYWLMHLTWDSDAGQPALEFLPADKYLGKSLYKVFPKLFKRFGKVNIAGIGRVNQPVMLVDCQGYDEFSHPLSIIYRWIVYGQDLDDRYSYHNPRCSVPISAEILAIFSANCLLSAGSKL